MATLKAFTHINLLIWMMILKFGFLGSKCLSSDGASLNPVVCLSVCLPSICRSSVRLLSVCPSAVCLPSVRLFIQQNHLWAQRALCCSWSPFYSIELVKPVLPIIGKGGGQVVYLWGRALTNLLGLSGKSPAHWMHNGLEWHHIVKFWSPPEGVWVSSYQ